MNTLPAAADIRDTAERISPFIHHTPVLHSSALNNIAGASLHFKCENFQKAGAFKSRGAVNAVLSLGDDVPAVCTHSSGNHAQALSRAAAIRSLPAYIVMPSNAPKVKVEAVRSYGGKITFCEPTLEARESTLEEVRKNTGAEEIHPYNDYRVIAGQATAAMELEQELPGLDAIIAPVGGGGLLSGTCLSRNYFFPDTLVYGAEPLGADDARRSLKASHIIPSINPDTIADGLLTSLGSRTFPIISSGVEDILCASDESIVKAMRLIWERMKIIVEPSAAVPLAVILEYPEQFSGKRIGIILSGGNLDLEKIPWIPK